jgi:FkbM family methyltransferase
MGLKKSVQRVVNRLRGYCRVTLAGAPLRCNGEDARFWGKVSRGQWEPHTFAILERYLHREAVYIDVGAWIGPTVLFAAPRCRQVYCFEPDPVAYERLLANLRLNSVSNVTSFHAAAYDHEGFILIGDPRGLGRSETSILKGHSTHTVRAACTTLEAMARQWQLTRVDLMKMDVEGAEFELLPAAAEFFRQYRPTLYLSLHPHHLEPSARPAAMARVAELARTYSRCLDRKLEPLDIARLTDPATLMDCREIVLTDK